MATPDSDDDHAAPERLTMAAFWRDFSDEVFSLDRGLPWSFWQLLVRPGQFIRLYIEQRDPRATRPVRYYLVGFVAAALLFEATSPFAELEGLLRSGGNMSGGAALWLVLQHAELLILLTFVPGIACGLRLAYGVHRPTFAEMWVFAVFAVAQLLIVWAATSALTALYPWLDVWLGIPLLVLTPVYLVVACLGYFPQPGAGRALRAAWASALGFSLSYAIAAAIAVGALQAGRQWPAILGG